MKVSRELYQEMQNQTAPKTKSYYTIPMAFLIGGFICTLGELLLHLYAFLGADQTAAAAFTSITLIGCSVLFTGLGWYEKIAKHAGAGTLVPITGFWALVQKSLRLPGLSLSTEQLPACSMD